MHIQSYRDIRLVLFGVDGHPDPGLPGPSDKSRQVLPAAAELPLCSVIGAPDEAFGVSEPVDDQPLNLTCVR